MDNDKKLDQILFKLDAIIEKLQDQDDAIAEVREAVTDLGLPGSGYTSFTPPED